MGAELSQLTPEQIETLKEKTPFDEVELGKHLRRYAVYDPSEKGTDGIHPDEVINIPEFIGNNIIKVMLENIYLSPDGRLYPEAFLYMCSALSSKNSLAYKRRMAFRCLDQRRTGRLQHQEMYTFYKAIFDRVITDDQILDLVFRALDNPDLTVPGEISADDFQNMVSDFEIRKRFTVDLQLPG